MSYPIAPSFGIMTAPMQVDYDDILRVWREADAIPEIEHAWLFDHLLPMLSDPQPSVRRAALYAIQDRVGLQFRDFDPEGSEEARGKAIARIRASIPKMKRTFDQFNEFELKRLKK